LLTFTDNNLSETNAITSPNGSQTNRLAFLTGKLKSDLHLSGQPVIDLQASLSTPQSNLAALLVDYGPANHVGRGGSDGVTNTTTRSCFGDSTAADSACYLEVTKPVQAVTQWRVSKGILDSSNRDSLIAGQASNVVPGQKYEFKFGVLPTEYTFPAGHQIGVVLLANYSMGVAGTRGAVVTVDTKASKVILPVTGGSAAAQATGAFVADTTAPVIGPAPADISVTTTDLSGTTVTYTPPTATDTQDAAPTVTCSKASGTKFAVGTTTVTCTATDANGNSSGTVSFKVTVTGVTTANGDVNGSVGATLALTLGAPASFGAFTPGVAKDYTASTTANVISTAGDAALSWSGPDHLTNGTFSLPSPLAVSFSKSAWTAPVSNDPVTIGFTQHIGAADALRTGAYSTTLTFTLSTTTP
jgi:X-Pro dipeptidyl-peptidase